MFGTIVMDVFLTTGPLLPSFSGTIAQVLVKPAATAVAVGVACNVLFFPESTSHVLLTDIKVVLGSMPGFIDACRLSFDNNARPMSSVRLQQAKASAIMKYKSLEAPYAFIPLDVSFGRWNAEDILLLRKPLRNVFVTWASLLESQITRSQSRALHQQFEEHEASLGRGEEKRETKPQIGRHQLAQQLDFVRLFRHGETKDLIFQSLAALRETSDPILLSCKASIEAIIESLAMANGPSFYSRPSPEAWASAHHRHSDALEKLRMEYKEFISNTPSRLLDPHAHFFDESGLLNPPPNSGIAPLRGVLFGLIFQERILSFARATEQLLAQTIAVEEKRTQARLWFPTGLRHLFSWAFGNEPAPQVTTVSREVEEARSDSKPKRPRRHPTKGQSQDDRGTTANQLKSIHLHRSKERSNASRFILALLNWISNTEGMFALRIVVVTIALAIPAAIPSSAGFYYREKGLWGLIMGQLALVPYTADFVWSLLLRFVGTIVGGVVGMVAWYIAAGDGTANPYGLAVVMVPIIVVLMFGRLYAPPAFTPAFMLTGATTYLAMAYSWINTHIPSYGNPGVGYQVFWRRILLVMIGFVGAAIVMYLPRPPSAGRHYRRVLAVTLSRFKDLYALYITSMHVGDVRIQAGEGSDDLMTTVEKDAITTSQTLASIMGPIQLLRYEFSSTDFKAAGLSQITNLATKINFNMLQLFYYTSQLPDEFRRQLTSLSSFFDEDFVGDLMAVLTLLGHSLVTGEALPSVLPAPLLARAFREYTNMTGSHNRPRKSTMAPNATSSTQTPTPATAPDTDEMHHRPLDDVMGPVTKQQIIEDSEGFRKFCVVLTSLVGLLTAIDDMVMVVKEELGETHIIDIEHWGGGGHASSSETQWLMDEKATEG